MKLFIDLLLICALFIPSVDAQIIQGKVTDAGNNAIPYAIVQVKEMKTGVYTNEQGDFTVDILTGMTLVIQCLGYERKEVAVNTIQYPFVVKLAEKNMGLPEVVVKAKDPTLKILGFKDLTCTGKGAATTGYEQGIYLYDKKARKSTLEEVYVYITTGGVPDTSFRIHVYEANRKTKLPIKELTRESIIAHADKADEWVEYISKTRI